MTDQQSKLPDVNEIVAMVSKLFRDVRTSVNEIITDYKAKHTVADEPVCTQKEEVKTTDTCTSEVKTKTTAKKVKKPAVRRQKKE